MKKLLAIVLALVFCLSLVACGGGDPAAVAKYLEENKADMMAGLATLEQMGLTGDITADGTTLVFAYSSEMFDGLTDEQIDALSASYDAMESTFDAMLSGAKSDCADIDALEFVLKDTSGKEVYTLTID